MSQELGISGDFEALERAWDERDQAHYVLRLYVTGGTFGSFRAIAGVRRVCDRYLAGHYDLQVIDLRQQPELCRQEDVVAAPTLVKEAPAPVRRLVGDMGDEKKVLAGLDLALPAGEGQP